jgi:hypothetical protein
MIRIKNTIIIFYDALLNRNGYTPETIEALFVLLDVLLSREQKEDFFLKLLEIRKEKHSEPSEKEMDNISFRFVGLSYHFQSRNCINQHEFNDIIRSLNIA